MNKRAKKAAPKKAEPKKPAVFNVALTEADIRNLIVIINGASIKGETAGTVWELKRKLVSVMPLPKKGESDAGNNPKT